MDEIIADYEGAGYSANYRDEPFYAERPALLKEHCASLSVKKMVWEVPSERLFGYVRVSRAQ